MTDDIYNQPYEWCSPRPYHYYKVKCVVYNKYTLEYSTFYLYISIKRSLKWLMSQSVDLPSTEYFTYDFTLKEVDDDGIVFHYIKSGEVWSSYLHKYFMMMAATSVWHISYKLRFNKWKKKLKNYFHKYSIRKMRYGYDNIV